MPDADAQYLGPTLQNPADPDPFRFIADPRIRRLEDVVAPEGSFTLGMLSLPLHPAAREEERRRLKVEELREKGIPQFLAAMSVVGQRGVLERSALKLVISRARKSMAARAPTDTFAASLEAYGSSLASRGGSRSLDRPGDPKVFYSDATLEMFIAERAADRAAQDLDVPYFLDDPTAQEDGEFLAWAHALREAREDYKLKHGIYDTSLYSYQHELWYRGTLQAYLDARYARDSWWDVPALVADFLDTVLEKAFELVSDYVIEPLLHAVMAEAKKRLPEWQFKLLLAAVEKLAAFIQRIRSGVDRACADVEQWAKEEGIPRGLVKFILKLGQLLLKVAALRAVVTRVLGRYRAIRGLADGKLLGGTPLGASSGRGSLNVAEGASRLHPDEIATGQRLARQLGRDLTESPHLGAEFVDDLGRSYDALGRPAASKYWSEREFLKSIDSHLLKANHFTAVDLTGFTSAQKTIVGAYLDGLPAVSQARIIKIGF